MDSSISIHRNNSRENAFESSCSIPRAVLITALGLAALAFVVAGVLAVMSIAPFSQIPTLYSGILLGAGGFLLTSLVLYTLTQCCAGSRSSRVQQEDEESVAHTRVTDEIDEDIEVDNSEEVKKIETEASKRKVSLLHAMQVLKNHDSSLVKRYATHSPTVEESQLHFSFGSSKEEKLTNTIHLLQTIMQEYPEWRKDQDFKVWIGYSLLQLRKKATALGVEDKRLTTMERECLMIDPPTAPLPTFSPLSLHSLKAKEVKRTPKIEYPGIVPASGTYTKSEGAVLTDARPKEYPSFTSPTDLALFKTWKEYLLSLYANEKSIEKVESETVAFLLKLPKAEALQAFLVGLDDEQREELLSDFYEVAMLSLTTHLKTERVLVHPSRILAYLKTLDQMLLIVQAIKSTHLRGVTLPMRIFKSVLNDSYLDLGPYQSAIQSQVQAIKRRGHMTYDLVGDNDHGLKPQWSRGLKKDSKFTSTLYNEPDLYEDERESRTLPRPVVLLRSFYDLAGRFSCPLEGFECGAPFPERREDFKDYWDKLKRAIKQAARTSMGGKKELVTAKSLDLKRADNDWKRRDTQRNWKKKIGTPISPYFTYEKPIREKEFRTRLVEGVVSNITVDYTDLDGNFGCEIKDSEDSGNSYGMEGLKQTPHKLLGDKFHFSKLSIEASRDLQAMASGRDNRASNALHTFAKYPALFLHAEHGEDLKRLFRLLIFRSDLLYRELLLNPHQAPILFEQFEYLLDFFEKNDLKMWVFLYKAQVDFLKNLGDKSPWAYEKHTKRTQSLTTYIEAAENRTDPECEKLRKELHLAFLYEKAVFGFKEEELVTVGQSFLVVQSVIDNMRLFHPREGQLLYDFTRVLSEQIIAHIETEGLEALNALLYPLLKGEEKTWEQLESGVYQCENFLLDLKQFQIIQNGEMEGALPKEVRENPSLAALFGEEALQKVYTFKLVETSLGKAWSIFIPGKGCQYRLYLKSGDVNFPLIFRQKEGSEWEQWIRIESATTTLPIDFMEGFLWEGVGHEGVVEGPTGKKLYQPTFTGEALTSLKHFRNGHQETVLDPKDEALFRRLDAPGSYIVTKTPKGHAVHYLRGKCEYVWNTSEQRWESAVYKGYFLSEKPIEKWKSPATKGILKHPFFASHFHHYHILEDKEGKGKLILPLCPYRRESKHGYALTPILESSAWVSNGFAAFDLEKNCHLKTERPQDAFYLAYILYIQGKYGEALLYLQQSQAVWTQTEKNASIFRNQVKEWILDWKDNSPNAGAFKVHMLLLEHQLREATFSGNDEILALDKEMLPQLLECAHQCWERKEEIDPLLQLTPSQIIDLKAIAPRAFSWVLNHLDSPFLSTEARKYYSESPPKNEEEALSWSLDQQIKELESFVTREKKEAPKVPTEFTPTPLLDLSSWLSPLAESETHKKASAIAESFVRELNEIFSGETLADEMGQELATDILRHKDNIDSQSTIAPTADLNRLLTDVLTPCEKSLRKQEKQARSQVLQFFLPPTLSSTQSIERKLKEQEARFDELFQKARFCFGRRNFSPLVEMGVISEEQIKPLEAALRAYEITRTDRQLINRKKQKVEKLIKDPTNTVLRDECAAILQEWRGYDPETHPFAHLLLLFEDELNIAARPSQMIHIHKLISHRDSYVHEAMAGGKTTFLRNLFSAIQSEYGYLPGVVTYSPLMAMHHKEYSAVNNLSVGSRAYPVFYDRNAPHDAVALKLMIIYHLKALSRHGRIDQTPQAAISLNHTLTELVLALKTTDERTRAEITPQINALQKLLKLRGEHLAVYSDEIDKIFDPSKDYHYAYGSADVLDEKFYAPALVLMKALREYSSLQTFMKALKEDSVQRMSDKDFETHLRTMAEVAFDTYKMPFPKEQMLDYLTEVHQKDKEKQNVVKEFYDSVILAHEDPEMVEAIQILHSYIGVLLRGMKNKRVGTDFGRSEDGIHVKPFSFSAVCQESSQRSFVLSTILEICMDYLVNGVEEEGVDAFVEAMKEKAVQQLDEFATTLDETDVGKSFNRDFGFQLSKVSKRDFGALVVKINGSYPLFESCLCEILLKKFTYHTEKIEGHAHLLSHLIGSFSGASGSPERVKTLPGSIHKHKDLIRQMGAIGSVFYSLFKDFDPEKDLIKLDPNCPFGGQIFDLLQPGDTLVDNAPFFSGKTGEEIVRLLGKSSTSSTPYRFLDEDDDIAVWDGERTRKGEGGIELKEVVSVIPHKGRQGTNWKFASGTKGVVEAGMTTELTSFYQSLMRFRLLGRGQKGQIAFDGALEKSWEGVKELEGKSFLAKITWTLVKNEEALVKRFHYQANRKEIRAVRSRVIDMIKHSITDTKALACIRELKTFELVESSPLSISSCGEPIQLGAASGSLVSLLEEEKKKLEALREEINSSDLEGSIKEKCLQIIDDNLKLLTEELVLDPRDLPETVPLNLSDINATEEMQVETMQQQQEETHVEQAVSLEVAIEMLVEQSVQTDLEIDEVSDHPHSEEGREWGEYAVAVCYRDNAGNAAVFPDVWVSNYGLGIYGGRIHAQEEEGKKQRKANLWFYTSVKSQMPIVQKVILMIHDGKLKCQMGSIKDADFYFDGILRDIKQAKEWIDLPIEEAATKDLTSFPLQRQRSFVEQKKKGSSVYDSGYESQLKKSFKVREYLAYKVDLRSTEIPSNLPVEFQDEWTRQVALAKFLYVDATFTTEERAFLETWLCTECLVPLKDLRRRLKSYLKKFYPSSVNNQLLNIIEAQME